MAGKQRYRLMVTVVDGDLIVLIKAEHRTKQSLREAFQLAKRFVTDGTLDSAEAWDDRTDTRLARAGNLTEETKG